MFSFTFLEKLRKNIPRSMQEGTQRRWRCTGKGAILSRERMAPLYPPREREGRAPRPPTLAVCSLNDCTRCAVRVRCTWLRHESSAIRYRFAPAPYCREARVTAARRQTACRCGIAALAALAQHRTTIFLFRCEKRIFDGQEPLLSPPS